jgi:hypothetical protein
MFSHYIYSQENSRAYTFFNDSLKGKWILQNSCFVENCETLGKNTEYVIFTEITPQDYVKFETNGSWCTSKGDSAKLFLHFSNSWKIDDFLFFDYEKTEIGIQFEFNKLFLITIAGGGRSKSYIRDKYNSVNQTINSESIKIYPNPFIDQINISYDTPNSTGKVLLNLYSATGLLLRKVEIAENGQSIKRISLEDLNTGIYFGVVSLNDKWINNLKLIKK